MTRRLPPTGALEAFLAAARGGTLTSASTELNLSVSALSRRIQTLESHVGGPLFERRHHELRLTNTGERLLAGMEPTFEKLGMLFEDLRDERTYSITVGVPPSFATAWLFPRLQRFRDQYPDVELLIDSSGSPMAKLGLSLDAIILFASRDEYHLDMHELRPQRAFAVTAPGMVDICSGLAEALRNFALISHSGLPEILPLWLEATGRTGTPLTKMESYDDGPLVVAAAENRLGIALVLEDMINFYPRTADLVRPFGESVPTPYSYYLATKPASGSHRALRWFSDWLIAEAEREARTLIDLAATA